MNKQTNNLRGPSLRLRRRRGITSVLAMFYLVLFSALALGFYAATTTSVQISRNDQNATKALAAADAGMDFMRYQLAGVNIPANTALANVVTENYNDLAAALNGTSNLAGATISKNGNTISIPGPDSAFINLDSTGDTSFRVTITDWAGEIVVKVTGRYGTATARASGMATLRTITMDFSRQDRPTASFDYAVASKGVVTVTKGSITAVDPTKNSIATVMSAATQAGAVNISGGTIGGDLNVVSGGTASVTGGSVGGTTNTSLIQSDHVHTVSDPNFPTFDTSIYKPYATTTWIDGKGLQKNIRIPANSNPSFNGGDTVQGIMYIESPNKVTFRGNFNLQGFIVFENAGSEAVNTLDFRGNVSQLPLPSGAQFDPLRATSGVSILAPTAGVTMSGSTDSLLNGNLILGKFAFAGSADIKIDQGTLMTLNPGVAATFSGKTVKFTATGGANMPTAGVTYAKYYTPKPTTYQEIMP